VYTYLVYKIHNVAAFCKILRHVLTHYDYFCTIYGGMTKQKAAFVFSIVIFGISPKTGFYGEKQYYEAKFTDIYIIC
jgi:hypothetical protein